MPDRRASGLMALSTSKVDSPSEGCDVELTGTGPSPAVEPFASKGAIPVNKPLLAVVYVVCIASKPHLSDDSSFFLIATRAGGPEN
ncbi:MAG: hypothetical protein FRX49_06497 [Trebouxia sp. A1-2]|nr:MAG: hypothetical protein FRX49_06497 [Trebouxia sp. A1-2]